MDAVSDLPIPASSTVRDPARLAAVRATGLLDTEEEEAFDRLTRLAVKLVRVPGAFISLVDEHRDFYKSTCGFGNPLASARELDGETFCHHTIQRTDPLVIPDTAADPLYRNIPTVRSLGVAAYVGVPLVVGGKVIGAFCTIDTKPRAWTADEIEVLVELAASAQREIELRSAVALATARAALVEMQAEELRVTAEALEAQSESEREARSDAEQANEAKSQFLAMMSHELRTPLNAIGGYAALLEDGIRGPVTPGQQEYLSRIQNSQRHLLGLINGILTYAKIDAGATQYTMETVRVDALIAVGESLTAPQVKAKGLVFETQANPTMWVVADREKAQQIVVNLVGNAIKFTERGGRITVTCRVDDGMIAIDVADTGCGIPASEIEGIFEPFVQVDSQSAAARLGTGLGLAISREFANGMNGDLRVVSEPGSGTTFTLRLPSA